MDATMDPGLVGKLWQHRFRGALLATIHQAGDAGAPEEDVVVAIGRFGAATGAPLESVAHVIRSLYVDGLLAREGGRVKLGPNFAAYMARWVDQRAVAVAPAEGEA